MATNLATAAAAGQPAEMPRLYPVRQKLHRSAIGKEQLAGYFQAMVAGSCLNRDLLAGKTVGICVGSRGISQIALLIRLLAGHVRSRSGCPVIIPSMGSHGGATAHGQAALLADYGITAELVGAKIQSGMEVVDAGPTKSGLKAYLDRIAAGCDSLIVINRIKEHTDFSGPIESGIQKMLAIGLGNHVGATYIHNSGSRGLCEFIPEIAARIIETRPVTGIGIIEDGYGEIDRIEIMPGPEICVREPELLSYAKSIKAKIPFQKLDCLVIEEMGKNISGAGADTKVIGRIRYPGVPEPAYPSPDIITCLRLTLASHGNAAGVGLVDLITKEFYDSIDFQAMFVNGMTTKCPERYKIPMFLASDREAVSTGLAFAQAIGSFRGRIAWIKNTAELKVMFISQPLLTQARNNQQMEVLSADGVNIEF